MRHTSLVIAMLGALICAVTGRYDVVNAETTPQGEFILYRWEVGGEKRYEVLKHDYAMMIFYDASQQGAKPTFVLHDRKEGVTVRTTDLQRFKQELKRIPAGQTLRSYNTCCGGTHSGLDRSILEDIRAFCQKKGVAFDDRFTGHIICTCL